MAHGSNSTQPPVNMSAILSPDDLNDFISPGVACIKPVESLPSNDNKNEVINLLVCVLFYFEKPLTNPTNRTLTK